MKNPTLAPPPIHLSMWPITLLQSLLAHKDVWLAGGPVRDLLLARSVYDWDFAVAGRARSLARQVANVLKGAYYTLDAERDAGRVVLEDPTIHRLTTLDFARLRGDTIEEDLRLRDFTINAMALTLDGLLIDPTDGQEDLQAGQIRQTSATSFQDDPARLLRAVRQAGQLEFEIEATTLWAIRKHAAEITQTSPERIRDELLKILRLPKSVASLQKLADLSLLPHVLPGIARMRREAKNVWDHTLATLSTQQAIVNILQASPFSYAPSSYPETAPAWAWEALIHTLAPFQAVLHDYLAEIEAAQLRRTDLLRWGALFHKVGQGLSLGIEKPTHRDNRVEESTRITRQHLEALRFPNRAIAFIETLVKAQSHHLELGNTSSLRRAIYRFYRDTDEAGVAGILLALADTLGKWEDHGQSTSWETQLHTAEAMLTAYFQRKDEIVTPPLLLSGYDLLSMGIPQGPEIGRLLEALREAQAAGEIATQEEALDFIRAQLQARKASDGPLQKPKGKV